MSRFYTEFFGIIDWSVVRIFVVLLKMLSFYEHLTVYIMYILIILKTINNNII